MVHYCFMTMVFLCTCTAFGRRVRPDRRRRHFAGGFINHIARTKDVSFENMKTAIIVGSAMASFCVEKFGPQRLKEITKR